MKLTKERVFTEVIQLQFTEEEANLFRRGLEEVDMYCVPTEVYGFLKDLCEKLDEFIED